MSYQFYDENGKLVFDQLIAWKNDNVQDWVLIPKRDDEKEFVIPFLIGGYAGHYYIYVHNRNGRVYKTYYHFIVDTYTQYDPELAERNILPKENRSMIWNR